MKHTKMTALLCTLALSGCISATAAPQAGSTPLDPYRAAVQKMKDLEKAEKKGEQSAPASAPVSYTHLDVYKRQIIFTFFTNIEKNIIIHIFQINFNSHLLGVRLNGLSKKR